MAYLEVILMKVREELWPLAVTPTKVKGAEVDNVAEEVTMVTLVTSLATLVDRAKAWSCR